MGYTFEIENGSFVKKDDMVGNNYNAFSEKLFEKYKSEYGFSGSSGGYYDSFGNYIPASSGEGKAIGTDIFNSSWAISEDGMDFYYIDTDGLLSLVTVGWDELGSRRILLG